MRLLLAQHILRSRVRLCARSKRSHDIVRLALLEMWLCDYVLAHNLDFFVYCQHRPNRFALGVEVCAARLVFS